jgi:phytoene dehydrogenase-like protein
LKVEEQVLRAHVFQMFPRIRGNIEWDRMMRLPVVDGAMPAFWQPWPDRPAPGDSDVPGLFFAGDTVGVPGQGGDIAFRSAIECAKAALSYLG